MKNRIIWISITTIIFGSVALLPMREVNADFFGGDLPLLAELIVKAVQQIAELNQIISTGRQTVGVLEDMNRGVKEVLRLADTAHIKLPPQVYEQANSIAQASALARNVYGDPPNHSPISTQNHFQSGTEALFLSQDAVDYSNFLDQTAENVKSSAVVANQASATRLSAETLGVVVEAVSHSNRLQAKSLEISATDRLESSQKDAAHYDSFIETSNSLETGFRTYSAPDLGAFSFDESVETKGGNP
jgi:hypothetical protein